MSEDDLNKLRERYDKFKEMYGSDDKDKLRERLDILHARAVNHLFVVYLGLFKQEDPQHAHDTTAVAGTLVAAALDVAAIVGLDLGMSEEQMGKILQESYKRAYEGTPKWAP
jgi:hypothetical protein